MHIIIYMYIYIYIYIYTNLEPDRPDPKATACKAPCMKSCLGIPLKGDPQIMYGDPLRGGDKNHIWGPRGSPMTNARCCASAFYVFFCIDPVERATPRPHLHAETRFSAPPALSFARLVARGALVHAPDLANRAHVALAPIGLVVAPEPER